MTASNSSSHETPLLQIITPGTTPEEVAAIVAVLASLGSACSPPARRTPEWNRPRRLTRITHRHGPDGWRSSSLPR